MFYIITFLLSLFNGICAIGMFYVSYTKSGAESYPCMISGIILTLLFIIPCTQLYGYHKEMKGMPFSLRLELSKTIIAQVKAGEWKPEIYNFIDQEQIYNLERNGQKMWVGSGSQFLKIDDTNVFGDILRLYVWHSAVKQVVKEANNKLANPQSGTDIINKTIGNKPTLKVVK